MIRARLLWLYDDGIAKGLSHERASVQAASRLIAHMETVPFGGDKNLAYRHYRAQLRAALTRRASL